jgi:hypothetical protein
MRIEIDYKGNKFYYNDNNEYHHMSISEYVRFVSIHGKIEVNIEK